jgi:hypothetical protein
MTNTNQNMNKSDNKSDTSDKATQINAKIKATWSKLSDDDVKLYSEKREDFFAALKTKQDVSKEDGEKKLQEIEKSIANDSSKEKTDATKAA